MPRDVALDHLHSRRPDPASVGKRRGVGRCAERLGEQVVDMGHGRMLQAGVSERRRFFVQQREIPLLAARAPAYRGEFGGNRRLRDW